MLRSKGSGGSVIGRRGPLVAVALLMVAGLAQPGLVLAGQIQWRGQTVTTPTQNETELTGAIDALAARPDARHVVIQFDQPVDSEQRADLAAAGVTLLRFLGDNAFFAALDRDQVDSPSAARVGSLTAVLPIDREWKLAPRVLAEDYPSWAIVADSEKPGAVKEGEDVEPPVRGFSEDPVVALYVMFHSDEPMNRCLNLAWQHGANVRSQLPTANALVVEMP
ncbi:MAG: hypothetical protein GY778_03525, partial [bacterium]|nr:hypothetical protein [bacterium]